MRKLLLTVLGIIVYIALMVTAVRCVRQMPDDRLTGELEGFIAGAILAWFAAMDWMRPYLRRRERQGHKR